MSISIDLLNTKAVMPIIIILLISSTGLGVNNHITGNYGNNVIIKNVDAEIQVLKSETVNLKTFFIKYLENEEKRLDEHKRQHETEKSEEIHSNELWKKQYDIDKKEHDKVLVDILLHLQKLNMMICQYNGFDCNV